MRPGILATAVVLVTHRACSQVPEWPPTWQMNRSTLLMPCNFTGFSNNEGWAIVDYDWSNARSLWAPAMPMNCDLLLAEQAHMTTTSSPGSTAWVYRNGVKALPWLAPVRDRLTDPDYKTWFLPFSGSGNYSVPQCDDNYVPPLCSDRYHDQQLTPGYPNGTGACAAPACDCGGVPCGEYLWDHRSANVSVRGQRMVDFFVEEYFFGVTGAGSADVSGFFVDDYWTADGGPSEMDPHAMQDLGFNRSQAQAMEDAWTWVMDQVYAAILTRGKFAFNLLWSNGDSSGAAYSGGRGGEGSGSSATGSFVAPAALGVSTAGSRQWRALTRRDPRSGPAASAAVTAAVTPALALSGTADGRSKPTTAGSGAPPRRGPRDSDPGPDPFPCPHPWVRRASCAADLRALCNASSPAQSRAMMYAFSPGSCTAAMDPSSLADAPQDVANFLLVRGPYAWLGHGWLGCSLQYERPGALLDADYGQPLGLCGEVGPVGSGVFQRQWSKATVAMDCNTWTPTLSLR